MTLVFLHIDKTGGMTLRNLLASQFRREAIYPVAHDTNARYQPTSYPLDAPNLYDAHRLFLSRYEKINHHLIMGHWDWSIVRHIRRPKIITVLCDPVQRFLSLYRFICNERAMFRQFSDEVREMGVAEFAIQCLPLYQFAMTTQLAGVRWAEQRVPDQAVDDAIFDQACRHLDQCDYVGVTEQLDIFIHHLVNDMGWMLPEGQPQRANVNPYPQLVMDDRMLTFVRNVCHYDYKLYLRAKERFEHDVQQSAVTQRL